MNILNRIFICVFILTATSFASQDSEGNLIELKTNPSVFPQPSPISLKILIDEGDKVVCNIDGFLEKNFNRCFAYPFEIEYKLQTKLLNPGEYNFNVSVYKKGRSIDRVSYPIVIAKAPDDERLPLWIWGASGSINGLKFFVEHGLVGGFMNAVFDLPSSDTARVNNMLKNYSKIADKAAILDYDLGALYSPLRSDFLKSNESLHRKIKGELPKGQKLSFRDILYPFEPGVIEYSKKLARQWTNFFKDYPAFSHALINTEYHSNYCLNKTAIEMAKREIGFDYNDLITGPGYHGMGELVAFDENKVADGIIEDNNKRYKFMKWWWTRGRGLALLNAVISDEIKNIRPDVLTWHDPYRLAAVYGSHRKLDAISTWTYGYPDIKRLAYTRFLTGAAKKENQLVIQTISLFQYANFVKETKDLSADLDQDNPKNSKYFVAGPDFTSEATWLVFSLKPDIICYFVPGQMIRHIYDPNKPAPDEYVAPQSTWKAIKAFSEKAAKPYGPTLKKCSRIKPQVALLNSAVAQWFSDIPRPHSGYPNEQTLPFAALLMMNHVQFDVLLDDDINMDTLKNYKTLVIPKADVFTRSMYDSLYSYAKKDGKIIADDTLKADIPNVQIVDYDLSYDRLVFSNIPASRRITMNQHRDKSEQYAKQLKKHLKDIKRYAFADSPRALTQSYLAGDYGYHFFVNDNRGYGPRFGQWKQFFEKGLPLSTKAYVSAEKDSVVYDLMNNQKIDTSYHNSYATADITLEPAWGNILAVLPEEIGKVSVTCPANSKPGDSINLDIKIIGKSGKQLKGIHPLKISCFSKGSLLWEKFTSTDPKNAYSCVYEMTIPLNMASKEIQIVAKELISNKNQNITIVLN